ncbi:hypothetical protein BDQ12DRAFT_722159 [Crucibulum laeve]|uniref:F-box domain-containing protein n=1 Tax=Crucibulum laeve TaxID=68775 RepID=A0A5C3MFL2_9AGAR|nr:hypothetical protein BDQ12DRAFT_722159 [Crucibulum laeve]
MSSISASELPVHDLSAKLPYEVWEQIFTRCLPDRPFIQPSASSAPLLLCSVGKLWRIMALSMPALWSSISVIISRPGCKPQLSLVSVWLERAAMRPLNVSLTLGGRPGILAHTNGVAAMESLLPFARYWRRAVIRIGPFLSLKAFLRLPKTNLISLLESLDILLPTSYEDAVSDLSEIEPCLPRLSSLCLATDLPESNIPLIVFPFRHLKELTIPSPTFTLDNCLDILQQLPELVSFSYDQMWGVFHHLREGPPLVMSNLRTLSLTTSSLHMHMFFDSLTLPSLSEFRLDGAYSFPTHSIVSLVTRSNCPLSTIILRLPVTEEDLIDCLTAVSASLTTFSIDGMETCVTDRLLTLLTVEDDNAPPLCPKLDNLGIGPLCLSSTDGILGKMADSRWKEPLHTARLKELNISVGKSHEKDIKRLLELYREGLYILSFEHPDILWAQ